VVKMLQDLGAEVDNGTANVWDDADRMAREIIAQDPEATYVHPFVGDVLTVGHATLVEEVRLQLAEAGVKDSRPDMIVCSVGGGGLIRGIMHGVNTTKEKHPEFGTPKIVGVQDFGADSFSQSYNSWLTNGGEPKVVTIPAITSKATSMGAKACSAETLDVACQYAGDVATRTRRMSTLVVDDAISGAACWQFYRDHQLMVEMACGAALAPVYQPRILEELVRGMEGKEGERKTVVIVVCGGSKVDAETLQTYERDYGTADGVDVKAMIDGRYL
jgi:L-serine/L-threonine ammonia-lyase